MSKFNPRLVVPLALCLFVTLLSVALVTAQGDDPPPDPSPTPTPAIDWSIIELPPHDPPPVGERIIPGSGANVPSEEASSDTVESATPEPIGSDLPQAPVIVADVGSTAYTVQSGDTLYRIAIHFGVSHLALASYNNLANPKLIYPGQTLRIPSADAPLPTPNSDAPSPMPNPELPPASGNSYVVQAGDSLYQIARRFGVTVQALIAANAITDPQRIYPGTILTIPGATDAPPPQPTSTPTSPPSTPTPAPSATPAPPDSGQKTYTVQSGDSLYLIARRFGVTVQALALVNQLNNWWRIYPGQVLVIPSPTDPLPTSTPIPEGTLYIWPLDSRAIVNGYKVGHQAIDIVVPIDTPVLAIADGVVEFAGWNTHGYGYLVVVDHGNGVRSLYAHHNSLAVTTGQTVAQGDTLGLSGNTGNSTMPHLHLELMINYGAVNPCSHLPGGC